MGDNRIKGSQEREANNRGMQNEDDAVKTWTGSASHSNIRHVPKQKKSRDEITRRGTILKRSTTHEESKPDIEKSTDAQKEAKKQKEDQVDVERKRKKGWTPQKLKTMFRRRKRELLRRMSRSAKLDAPYHLQNPNAASFWDMLLLPCSLCPLNSLPLSKCRLVDVMIGKYMCNKKRNGRRRRNQNAFQSASSTFHQTFRVEVT